MSYSIYEINKKIYKSEMTEKEWNFIKENIKICEETDTYSRTILETICNVNNTEYFDIIYNINFNPEFNNFQSMRLAAKNNLYMMKKIYEKYKDKCINAKGTMNGTPIHYAALGGKIENVKWLMEKGANSYDKDNNYKSAFHYAKEKNFQEIIDFLIEFNRKK